MRKTFFVCVFLALLTEWLSASFIDFGEGSSPCVFCICVYQTRHSQYVDGKCVCVCRVSHVCAVLFAIFQDFYQGYFALCEWKRKRSDDFNREQNNALQCLTVVSCIWSLCACVCDVTVNIYVFLCRSDVKLKRWFSTNWNPFISACFQCISSYTYRLLFRVFLFRWR